MPEIVSVSKIDFPHRLPQKDLKRFASDIFRTNFPDMENLLAVFDNAKIDFRNFCVPLEYFRDTKTFQKKNELYIKNAVKYSVMAAEECLSKAGINKSELTDIVFVSTTGLSTPSIDAFIINEMNLNEGINRLPVWGLGCGGGAAGIAKANVISKANPDAVVLLIAAELCSLTFIKNDLSKSNLIAVSLFSDGISAVIITGDNYIKDFLNKYRIKILDSQSRIYYDSLDVMGWEVIDEGFKVIFSKDIPAIIKLNVKKDVTDFLKKNNLDIKQIKNFITHPGGTKVINAYIDALELKPSLLKNTLGSLREYGNMSSASVLYVLDKFYENGFEEGYGLIMSLGPGFSLEMILVSVNI